MSVAYREPARTVDALRAGDRGRAGPDAVDILRIVRARWPLFRGVALGVVALTLVVLFAIPSSYSTSAVIMLEQRKNNVTDQSSVLSETPTDPASIQNQIQLLTSRDLAARVVEKLGLEHDPEFNAPPSPFDPRNWLGSARAADPARRADAVETAFLRHLSVDGIGLSTTITVTFSSRDPEKAALIADTIVETYLEMQAAIRFDVTQRTTDWLLDRIRQLGQQVQAADAAIQRYKAENNLNDTTNGGSLVDQQLAAINTQLVTAREDLAAKEAENARIVSLVQAGRAADVSQVVSSPLIIELREQQTDAIRQQALLATRYGPQHPKMQAAESQKRDLDAKIDEEVHRIEGSVQNEVDVARAQVRSLQDSLQRAEQEATGQNMARVKLQSLESNASSTRSMYESFVTRLRETQGQDGLQTVDARQISRAPIPNAPSSPPRLPIALASIPAGLLLGLLAVLLAERFGAAPVPRPAQRQPAAPSRDPLRGARVLAEWPSAVVQHSAEWIVERPISPPAQSLRELAGSIAAQRPRIVVVTSLDPREGQTSIAAGLARGASQLGVRVILLDGNLRTPATARRLGLNPGQAGLVDVLGGKAKLTQALQKDPRSAAWLLAGAPCTVSPHSVWSSQAMQQLLAHLRRASDLVVIDAVPIAPGCELPLIARFADAMIVVAGPNGAPRIGAALDYLASTATTIPTGVVLGR